MSQRSEKYARRMTLRMDKLERSLEQMERAGEARREEKRSQEAFEQAVFAVRERQEREWDRDQAQARRRASRERRRAVRWRAAAVLLALLLVLLLTAALIMGPPQNGNFVGRGDARERTEISPEAETEASGLCGDEAAALGAAVLRPALGTDREETEVSGRSGGKAAPAALLTVEEAPGDTAGTVSGGPEEEENEKIEAALLARAEKIENVKVTHYCICETCCGKTPEDPAYGITASGLRATTGVSVGVDPSVIPLGADVLVDYGDGTGLHYYRADDTGSGVTGAHIDLCVSSHREAEELGIRRATVYWTKP